MNSKASRRVGVVTVTFNSGQVLPDFLDSLATQSGASIHLVAVDNASGDTSIAQLTNETRLGEITIIANDENLGVAIGNNQGIQAALDAGCDWVLLLNNDTVLPPEAISILVREAEENNLKVLSPAIAASDPPGTIWYGDGRFVPSQGYRTQHSTMGKPLADLPKTLTRTGYASTCCLLVHPSVFDAVGLMDPVYFVYFDDVDFAVRCTKAGIEYWITPATQILHKASSLTGGKSSPFTIKWTSRNWPLIARRHLAIPQRTIALAFIQAWMVARVLTRRDSLATFRIRQSSFWEGLRAAASAPPPPRVSAQAAGTSDRA
ncbi:MAG: glycosyltransferase family 2 protein [Rhodoglobus sp.]